MTADELLLLLASPGGGDADVRERERAFAALLAVPEEAHARALEALENGEFPAAALAPLLARLGRAESVPALARLLDSPFETVRRAGAAALVAHPAASAREALVDAKNKGTPEAADILDAG
jgi:hypothetical protein